MNPNLVRIVAREPAALACLTARQREVWSLLIVEYNVSAAARALGISRHAVQDSFRLIVKKLSRFAKAAS